MNIFLASEDRGLAFYPLSKSLNILFIPGILAKCGGTIA
jgi:hypothetical protein